MNVGLVRDDLLVEMIRVDLLLAVCCRGFPLVSMSNEGGMAMRTCFQEINKVLQELVGELFNVFLGIFADEQHLSDMRFALDMAPW